MIFGRGKQPHCANGLNHVEWLKKSYPEIELLGLILLTDCRTVSEKGSPADSMFFGSQEKLGTVWNDFLSVLERVKLKSQIERVIDASKIGELPEWSPEGIFKRLSDGKM